jgi:SAM-dependent methyltransferase/FKBP-type peptidyl-prolyl cis-trans isomerase 2
MQKINHHSIIQLEFELHWQSSEATHSEYYYAPAVNMWRDIFPDVIQAALLGSRKNDRLSFAFDAGEVVPAYRNDKVLKIHRRQFRQVNVNGVPLQPRPGRFYPAGLLHGVKSLYPQTMQPFRLVAMNSNSMTVDLNHPLSQYPLKMNICVKNIQPTKVERGGRCTDWLEETTANGPGMQARWHQTATAFEDSANSMRQDETDDALFYKTPRLVGHVDSLASRMIRRFYSNHLQAGDTVLDLMSSIQSHMPIDYDLQVTGLGLNEAEMQENPILEQFLVQDLNSQQVLPFKNEEFNTVVCSLSVEYLIRPREIVREIQRVLKPEGRLLISFSNRWFPPKVTRLWTEIHDFERMGLILDYLIEDKGFHCLQTYSARNWPRPTDDIHAHEIMNSDPVFVVVGTKTEDAI